MAGNVLGEATVLVGADLAPLQRDLKLVTNQVSQAAQQMGQSFQMAFNSKTLSSKTLMGVKLGLLAFGAAALATHPSVQALGDAIVGLGHAIIDATIGPSIQAAADALNAFNQAASQMGFVKAFETVFSPQTQYTILGIAGAIMGALVPALWAKVTALWADAAASIAAAGGLWALVSAVWAAIAPLLLWAAIGAAVVMAAWWIYQNWDTVVKYLSAAWQWLKDTAVSIFDAIKNFLVSWGQRIWAFLKQHWDEILIIFFNVFGLLVVTVIRNWDKIKAFTISVWNGIKAFFQSYWNLLKAIYGPALQWIWNKVSSAWNSIRSTTSSVWGSIKSFLSSVWSGVKSAFSSAWNAIKSVAVSVWNAIWSTVKSKVNGIIGFVNSFIRVINRAISAVNKLAGTSFGGIPSIPGLASGGIVTRPTVAMVGEGRYHEAVLPLSDKTFRALADGITSRMGGGAGTVVNVYPQRAEIDEYDLANIIRRQQWMMGD